MRQKLAELEASVANSVGVEKIERIWLCLRWALHVERRSPGELDLAALGSRLEGTLCRELDFLAPALHTHAAILRELCSEVAACPVSRQGPVLRDLEVFVADGKRGRKRS
jgi:hypothetical protein